MRGEKVKKKISVNAHSDGGKSLWYLQRWVMTQDFTVGVHETGRRKISYKELLPLQRLPLGFYVDGNHWGVVLLRWFESPLNLICEEEKA